MNIRKIGFGVSILLFSLNCFSAKVCAYINAETSWSGGVFSVIDQNGYTMATTSFIKTGESGCTSSFEPGYYNIRFNGVLSGTGAKLKEGLGGCMTDIYKIDDNIFTVVFHKGNPPFNNNEQCFP